MAATSVASPAELAVLGCAKRLPVGPLRAAAETSSMRYRLSRRYCLRGTATGWRRLRSASGSGYRSSDCRTSRILKNGDCTVNARASKHAAEEDHRGDGVVREHLVTLETNVDDMSPQLMAYTTEQLLAAGALDAWIVQETTSLGVRINQCERVLGKHDWSLREITPVQMTAHPEYEDCAKLARKYHVPLKVVFNAAQEKFRSCLD
eukprot:SM000011S19137  [mRNA]  locus=s11:1039521:1041252:- [translate_table: standard]